jgi:mug G:T/U mismatch-specific DNA glycosylase
MRPTIFHSKLNFSSKFSFHYANPLAISCEIEDSSDAKMSKIVPANLEPIFSGARIVQVFANGGKAHEICEKYLRTQILNATGREPIKLPSTSPANANFSLERLV